MGRIGGVDSRQDTIGAERFVSIETNESELVLKLFWMYKLCLMVVSYYCCGLIS